jgi:hypothetical protein
MSVFVFVFVYLLVWQKNIYLFVDMSSFSVPNNCVLLTSCLCTYKSLYLLSISSCLYPRFYPTFARCSFFFPLSVSLFSPLISLCLGFPLVFAAFFVFKSLPLKGTGARDFRPLFYETASYGPLSHILNLFRIRLRIRGDDRIRKMFPGV